MADTAEVRLICGAKSDYGPEWALCNNWKTFPLQLGAGNGFAIPDADAAGWSITFDGAQPIVRCPTHAQQELT